MGRFKWHESLKNWRGVLPIVGGILINLTLGSVYSYGNMVPYIVSYCRLRGNSPNLSYQSASYILAWMEVGIGASMWVGGWLERKVGVRWATFIGSALFSASVVVTAWTITVSFYFSLLTYGLLFGLGVGLAYVPPLVCVMKWHPDSKGVAIGCVLAGFGAGAFIFNFVQTGFINPDNLQPTLRIEDGDSKQLFYDQESILDRVPMSFVVQAIIFAIMQLIGIAMLQDPPNLFKRTRRHAVRRKKKSVDEKSAILMNEKVPSSRSETIQSGDRDPAPPDIEDQPSTSSHGASSSPGSDIVKLDDQNQRIHEHRTNGDTTPGTVGDDHDQEWSEMRTVPPSQVIKEPFFWQLVAMLFLDNIAIVYIASLYKAFGVTFISDDIFLTTVGSCASIFNAAGRFFGGIFVDKFSFKVSFVTLSSLMAAFTFTFPLNVYGNKPMFFIWVCVIFFVIGGVYSTVPIATARAFGAEFFGINYGMVYMIGLSLSALIGASIQQIVFSHLPWEVLLIIIGGFPAISVIVCLFVHAKTPDGDDV